MLAAILLVAVSVTAAGLINAVLLKRFVQGQIDARLDGELAAITAALKLTSGGYLALDGALDLPSSRMPGPGWYWQVSGPTFTYKSPTLSSEALVVRGDGIRPPPRLRPGEAWPARLKGPRGDDLIARVADRVVEGSAIRIVATAPASSVSGPLGDMLAPLLLSMGALASLLLAVLWFGVRASLRPLLNLRRDLLAVRQGQSKRVDTTGHTSEILPVLNELNTLLDQNEAGLERARRHVANLAHGLKTPLATMSVALSEPGRDPDGNLTASVSSMDRLIRHHLGRARASALGGPSRSQTDISACIDDVAAAVGKIYGHKRIAFDFQRSGKVFALCEPQDCNEIFGNLIDNAFRHAETRVRAELSLAGRMVSVRIEDDGHGISPELKDELMRPGHSLDETSAGYGFGLPIARELAELYGGSVVLDDAQPRGLQVSVCLPAVIRRDPDGSADRHCR
jgi:signal transduction histidine kinase